MGRTAIIRLTHCCPARIVPSQYCIIAKAYRLKPTKALGPRATGRQSASHAMQARREPQRGPGNHYRGARSQPHSVCPEKASREKKRGEGCPLALTIGQGVCGSVISSPNGVRGEARTESGFYAYLRMQKEAIWNTLFSILSDGRAPQTSRVPRKLSPSPSRRVCCHVGSLHLPPDTSERALL